MEEIISSSCVTLALLAHLTLAPVLTCQFFFKDSNYPDYLIKHELEDKRGRGRVI